MCPQDGTPLERIGEETAEQLEFIPARVRVLEHVRPKYACPCCRQGVQIAPAAGDLPEEHRHPLAARPHHHRQVRRRRAALPPGSRSSAAWGSRSAAAPWRCGRSDWADALVPLINLLNEHLLAESVIHCDDGRLQVLQERQGANRRPLDWVRCAGPPGGASCCSTTTPREEGRAVAAAGGFRGVGHRRLCAYDGAAAGSS
ncbi:MAG: IS66 family transposase zinc-finger binding domain-containing protein [Proteobacteria bacterium]|nr:IS66 family transposase zinc-finger binding domain-containing protein [Pseudomonadota bacterium]